MDITDGAGDAVRISQSCEVAELATLGANRDVEPDAMEVVSLSSSTSFEVRFILVGRKATCIEIRKQCPEIHEEQIGHEMNGRRQPFFICNVLQLTDKVSTAEDALTTEDVSKDP